jgi:Tol biopolymer transport system component
MLEPNGHVTRLTDSDEYESDPCFSSDGRLIVYAVGQESSEGDRLAILDLSTKQTRFITDAGGNDFSPSFSPDGKSVTYLHQSGYAWGGMTPGWDSPAEIRRIQTDGAEPVYLGYLTKANSSLPMGG